MTIQARLEERLATFKNPTPTTEDGDTTLDPFIEDFKGWVRIQPLGGSEETIGDQTQSSRTSLVTMRYDSRVRARMQMHMGNRVFEIVQPPLDIDERHIELQLTCRELV